MLRGDPTQSVRPETRARIVDAARTLLYRPNALARALRTRRVGTIGYVLPSLDNVSLSEVTHGVQREAAASGQLVLVVEADSLPPDGEAQPGGIYGRLVSDGLVDGLIGAFASLNDDLVRGMAERSMPVILVNRRTSGVHGSVIVDDERGITDAVNHLLDLGHRRIGYVGVAAQIDTAFRRDLGFRRAVAAAGISGADAPMAAAPATIAGGRSGLASLLHGSGSELPSAVVSASLLGAVGILAEARAEGIAVPDELSVIAFNDHELAAHLDPPLTAVKMPNFRMGQAAVQMLMAVLAGEPMRDLVIDDPPEVIVRASTRPPHRAAAAKASASAPRDQRARTPASERTAGE